VLFVRNLDDLRRLALKLGNLGLNGLDDLVGDGLVGLNTDGVALSLGTREAHHAGKLLSVVGAAGLDDDVADVSTAATDDVTVVLLFNIKSTAYSRIKDLGSFFDLLLGVLNSLLGTLDLDFDTSGSISGLAVVGDIDVSASGETKSLKLTTTSTNQRRQLVLLDRDGGSVGGVHGVLQEVEKFISGLVSTSLRTLDDNFVGGLVRLALSCVVVLTVVRAREVNSNIVSVLETVDHAALGADQVFVVLRLDLDNVGSFVLELLAESKNVSLASIGLGLGALELDLAIVDLDIDVELLAKFSDVLTLLADQDVSELLGEVESEGETTLEFVLLLLLDESEQALDKCISTVAGTTDREPLSRGLASSLSTKQNLDRDLV
jgi:hypothetical protein